MELKGLNSLNRAYMWRIINSHVRAGDTTIEYFTTILKQSLG